MTELDICQYLFIVVTYQLFSWDWLFMQEILNKHIWMESHKNSTVGSVRAENPDLEVHGK